MKPTSVPIVATPYTPQGPSQFARCHVNHEPAVYHVVFNAGSSYNDSSEYTWGPSQNDTSTSPDVLLQRMCSVCFVFGVFLLSDSCLEQFAFIAQFSTGRQHCRSKAAVRGATWGRRRRPSLICRRSWSLFATHTADASAVLTMLTLHAVAAWCGLNDIEATLDGCGFRQMTYCVMSSSCFRALVSIRVHARKSFISVRGSFAASEF